MRKYKFQQNDIQLNDALESIFANVYSGFQYKRFFCSLHFFSAMTQHRLNSHNQNTWIKFK